MATSEVGCKTNLRAGAAENSCRARVPFVGAPRFSVPDVFAVESEPTMAMSREQARTEHTASTTHDQFNETIYGVVCHMPTI